MSIIDADDLKLETDVGTQHSVFGLIKSLLSIAALKIPYWKTSTNIRPGIMALLKMAKALRRIATDTESTHESLAHEADQSFPYFRFNVERGVGDIGLHDWKNFDVLAANTTAYLRTYEISKKMQECSRFLIDPSAFYGKEPRFRIRN